MITQKYHPKTVLSQIADSLRHVFLVNQEDKKPNQLAKGEPKLEGYLAKTPDQQVALALDVIKLIPHFKVPSQEEQEKHHRSLGELIREGKALKQSKVQILEWASQYEKFSRFLPKYEPEEMALLDVDSFSTEIKHSLVSYYETSLFDSAEAIILEVI